MRKALQFYGVCKDRWKTEREVHDYNNIFAERIAKFQLGGKARHLGNKKSHQGPNIMVTRCELVHTLTPWKPGMWSR